MRNLLTALALVFISTNAIAEKRPMGFGISIEPVVGYERVQKLLPVQRTREQIVYGARVTAGLPLISAEGEFTRSVDNETLSSPALTIKDTTDRARVGLRSSLRIAIISIFARGGCQARRSIRDETDSNGTTRVEDPITYKPYAGAGLKIHMGSRFSLTADITTVFKDFPNFAGNEYMTTAGFSVRFP